MFPLHKPYARRIFSLCTRAHYTFLLFSLSFLLLYARCFYLAKRIFREQCLPSVFFFHVIKLFAEKLKSTIDSEMKLVCVEFFFVCCFPRSKISRLPQSHSNEGMVNKRARATRVVHTAYETPVAELHLLQILIIKIVHNRNVNVEHTTNGTEAA